MSADLMPLLGYNHIEYYVGNAKQAMHYYRTAFGFTPVAYAGPETGVRDRASWVLRQGRITFVLTAGLDHESEITAHQHRHGDGVKDVALAVPDAEAAYAAALERGAEGLQEPTVTEDDHGKVVIAKIAAYGDTVHSFVDTTNYSGPFLPGYRAVSDAPTASTGTTTPLYAPAGTPIGIEYVDHVVANTYLGGMDELVRFYADIMGFSQLVHYDDEAISTEYSALMSKVLWDGTGRIKLPINEPATGKKKSQIEEYLDYYGSPGVQHLALHTDDIVTTVKALRENGVRFMRVPETYYAEQREKLDWDEIAEPLEALAEQNILIDTDEEGYLLQIFTEPVQDRPTVFYEIIERHGAKGFGEGNFKALFEAIEREQELRGNL
ncbi:4-hydroxyphenylpyruvate dioxygenase [Euzebya sp.]|uniref:4-hydroxyphenylpyruvate dioxygenase n=1 Tax=Euzebya sp. TaxID=1971409 RepID=UPI003517B248